MKKLFLFVAIAFLVIGIAGFVAWGNDLLPGSGEHGENWQRWELAITITWTIIQLSFPASVVSAAVYLVVKPRSRSSLILGVSILATAFAVAAWIAFVMTHLRIQ